MIVINLTQHAASQDQISSGVKDLTGNQLAGLKTALTFEDLPTPDEVWQRAEFIADLAKTTGENAAMIGGAPYLMAALESTLRAVGITPLYAFSKRESKEVIHSDGSVRKVNVFRHIGFIGLDDD